MKKMSMSEKTSKAEKKASVKGKYAGAAPFSGAVVDKKAGKPDIHCADHEHLSNTNLRGANKAHATRKWKP